MLNTSACALATEVGETTADGNRLVQTVSLSGRLIGLPHHRELAEILHLDLGQRDVLVSDQARVRIPIDDGQPISIAHEALIGYSGSAFDVLVSQIRLRLPFQMFAIAVRVSPRDAQSACSVILHQGHGSQFDAGMSDALESVLSVGCEAYLMEMPVQTNSLFQSRNSSMAFLRDGTHFGLGGEGPGLHDALFQLEALAGRPVLDLFIQPVVDLASFVLSETGNQPIVAGISGGGWITHVASAVDPGIVTSIAIAGSLPNRGGDYEQSHESILGFGYERIYALAATPLRRRHVHVLSYSDPCCFAQAKPEAWIESVHSEMRRIDSASPPEQYSAVVVHGEFNHKIGWHSTGLILAAVMEQQLETPH